MCVTKLDQSQQVYVVMGIDEHENSQLLAVCSCYDSAKRYCIHCVVESQFYDLWIEKHCIID